MTVAAGAIPANIDLLIYTGDSFSVNLTLTNNGAAVDLTGYTATAQIRSSASSSIVIATFTCTIAANVITLALTNAVTATLGMSVWDLQLTAPSTKTTTLAWGQVRVQQDVTR